MKKTSPSKGKSFSFLLSFGQKWKFTAPGCPHTMVIFVYADKKEPLQALNPFQLPKGSFPSPHSSGVLQYLICRQMHLSFSLYSSGMKSMILLNVSC